MTSSDEVLRRAMEKELETALVREHDFRRTLRAAAATLNAIRLNPCNASSVEGLSEACLAFIEQNTGISP